MYNLELIKKGHPICCRDGRKLIFEYVTEERIWCRHPFEENASAYDIKTGFWRNDKQSSCADIILDKTTNFQFSIL